MDILKHTEKYADELILHRRELHRRAELGFCEFRTTEYIVRELEKIGIPLRKTEPTGVIAEIANGEGKTVVLRADIDALPLTEMTGADFKSETEGVMHACGHDAHAAMLLTAAKVLNETKDCWRGNVRFVFQPAEEIAAGAAAMIAQGALENADMAFGIHVVSTEPEGVLSFKSGAIHAGSKTFAITVNGRACHGAAPESGNDATIAAAAIVLALQTIVSRSITPTEPACVSVGKLTSGTNHNIISGRAVMEGTIRYFSAEVAELIMKRITEIACDTAKSFGCTAKAEFKDGAQILVCDDSAAKTAMRAAERIVPKEKTAELMCKTASEDFAEYAKIVPAAFGTLGVGGDEPLHCDRMNMNEECLIIGAAMHVSFVFSALNG